MKMPAIDDLVLIEFLDHDQTNDEVDSITAYGRVAMVTANEVVIDSWHATEDTDMPRSEQKRQNALDSSAIVRKAIINWYLLVKGENNGGKRQ
jgi:hypothetical protein